MGRICAVIGCSNSTFKLDKWYSQLCDRHGLKYGACVCTPSFVPFPFPLQNKDADGRRRWIKAINRKLPNGKNWQPTYGDRVCSYHFRDGQPSAAWPDPTKWIWDTAQHTSLHINLFVCLQEKDLSAKKRRNQHVNGKERKSTWQEILTFMDPLLLMSTKKLMRQLQVIWRKDLIILLVHISLITIMGYIVIKDYVPALDVLQSKNKLKIYNRGIVINRQSWKLQRNSMVRNVILIWLLLSRELIKLSDCTLDLNPKKSWVISPFLNIMFLVICWTIWL